MVGSEWECASGDLLNTGLHLVSVSPGQRKRERERPGIKGESYEIKFITLGRLLWYRSVAALLSGQKIGLEWPYNTPYGK